MSKDYSSGPNARLVYAWNGEVEGLHAEIKRLRNGIQAYLDGNYGFDYGGSKTRTCQHGAYRHENCGQCIDEHFIALIGRM